MLPLGTYFTSSGGALDRDEVVLVAELQRGLAWAPAVVYG
jgi:hypothetical protein